MSQGRTSIPEPALLLWIILHVLMLRLILTVLQMFQNSYYYGFYYFAVKRIVLLAWGQNKADIIKRTIQEDISAEVPYFLQNHANTTFVLDQSAASELTRFKTPGWLVTAYGLKN
jgi:hypothetical protein